MKSNEIPIDTIRIEPETVELDSDQVEDPSLAKLLKDQNYNAYFPPKHPKNPLPETHVIYLTTEDWLPEVHATTIGDIDLILAQPNYLTEMHPALQLAKDRLNQIQSDKLLPQNALRNVSITHEDAHRLQETRTRKTEEFNKLLALIEPGRSLTSEQRLLRHEFLFYNMLAYTYGEAEAMLFGYKNSDVTLEQKEAMIFSIVTYDLTGLLSAKKGDNQQITFESKIGDLVSRLRNGTPDMPYVDDHEMAALLFITKDPDLIEKIATFKIFPKELRELIMASTQAFFEDPTAVCRNALENDAFHKAIDVNMLKHADIRHEKLEQMKASLSRGN